MRFLIGEFSHESNCFCQHTTGEKEFEQWELQWGEAMLDSHRGKHTVLGGFIDGLSDGGHDILGSVAATAVPSGPIEAAFYQRIKSHLVKAVH